MRPQVLKLLGKALIAILLLNSFAGFAPALTVAWAQGTQNKPEPQRNRVIVINADQPNVWTLEQAHYLLAQMHRRNLDLKAKSLEDLDPNEINGLRFDVMRQLIEFGATFNQADLAANRMLSRQQNVNAARRQTLINRRDTLREESLGLTRDISRLESDKANADTDAEKERLDAEIAAKKSLRDEVDKQIGFTDDELATLTAPSGDLKATEAEVEFNPEKLPKSVFDDAFKDAAKKQIERFNEAPKLNATLRLENFLQMQYEIIAKQLTLLRDEVGPGERLLFLELPQTVNVTHQEADNKWAQSWWKIVGYTRREQMKAARASIPAPSPAPRDNQKPITTADDYRSIFEGKEILVEEKPASLPSPTPTPEFIKYVSKFINLDDVNRDKDKRSTELSAYLNDNNIELSNRLVRTVDLIPRQSSLNVNDMNLQVKSGALSVVASFLFGFGARLNVQRQREQFSQFVQQELYSSAFGKGSREFGWTFTPMPGTNRLLSGVRTTYAVVIVPEEATSLVLESNGCYFPRTAYQPNNFADTKTDRWGDSRTSRGCSNKSKAFVVPIPNGGDDESNDFWVRGISYQPVGKGKRIVVLISGKNFSSQIGVLVNGVPLAQSIGLAQPLIRDDSKAGAAASDELKSGKVRGRIERVDANKIVFSFDVDDFEGTPAITLVAPNKAIDINWLTNVTINGSDPASLTPPVIPCDKTSPTPIPDCVTVCEKPGQRDCLTVAAEMFKGDPVRPLRIDSVEVFRRANNKITAVITGAGFDAANSVYVNGESIPNAYKSPTLLLAGDIDAPSDDKIQVTVSAGNKTIKSTAVANPAQLKIDKVTIVSYEAAEGKRQAVLVVRLEGSGFTNNLQSLEPGKVKVDVTSSTEAFLTIRNPNEAEVVTLKDKVTNITVSTVVTRKRPPK